jgi:hypothetical protein
VVTVGVSTDAEVLRDVDAIVDAKGVLDVWDEVGCSTSVLDCAAGTVETETELSVTEIVGLVIAWLVVSTVSVVGLTMITDGEVVVGKIVVLVVGTVALCTGLVVVSSVVCEDILSERVFTAGVEDARAQLYTVTVTTSGVVVAVEHPLAINAISVHFSCPITGVVYRFHSVSDAGQA